MFGGILDTAQKAGNGGGIVVAGARNGLSVDADGYIVLGNAVDEGEAALIDDRDVPLFGKKISFKGAFGAVVAITEGVNNDGVIEVEVPENSGELDNANVGIYLHSIVNGNFYAARAFNEAGTSDATAAYIAENDIFHAVRIGIGSSTHSIFPDGAFIVFGAQAFDIFSEAGGDINFNFGGDISASVRVDEVEIDVPLLVIAPDGLTTPLATFIADNFNRDGILVTYGGDATNGLHLQYRQIAFPADSNSALSFPGGGNMVSTGFDFNMLTGSGNTVSLDGYLKTGDANESGDAGKVKFGRMVIGTPTLLQENRYIPVTIQATDGSFQDVWIAIARPVA